MTTVSDDFNRADNASSLGVTSVGGLTWVPASWSTWGIGSNQAKYVSNGGVPSGAPPAYAYIDIGAADCTLQVKIGTVASEGIAFRIAGDSSLLYAHRTELTKFTGSWSTLATYTAFAVADVMTVVLSGSSIIVKKNGSTVATVTETLNQAVTKHGLGSETTNSVLDDFSVTYTAPATGRRSSIVMPRRTTVMRAAVR